MFFRHLLTLSCAITCLGLFSPVYANTSQTHRPIGYIAEQELRHISTYYPGRMIGSPAELMTADYINQRFKQMGYESDLREFKTRYLYTESDEQQTWRDVTGTSVIAVKPGNSHQQILITAHLDTYTPMSDADVNANLGGLSLQGSDDNASGVGVLLELAERLRNVNTNATLRFLVLSGEEIGNKGAEDYLSRMSGEEKRNTQLVINIDAVITGDRLYFHSGKRTRLDVAGKTRDRAIALAKRFGIPASINEGHHPLYPKGTGCCSDHIVFDNAGIPVMAVEASNWNTGRGDGYQQTSDQDKFPGGSSWHKPQYDNLKYLDEHLPGRIKARTRDTVKILLPLVQELAGK